MNLAIRKPLKVLIVDDSFIIRKLVSEIVISDKDFVVAGQAENGKAALRLVREVKPDLVLLDTEMPEMSGLETLRRLGLRSPCHVIVLSSLVGAGDSKERLEALRLGAVATISKQAVPGDQSRPQAEARFRNCRSDATCCRASRTGRRRSRRSAGAGRRCRASLERCPRLLHWGRSDLRSGRKAGPG
jgi:chemotaxis response regulator CheB